MCFWKSWRWEEGGDSVKALLPACTPGRLRVKSLVCSQWWMLIQQSQPGTKTWMVSGKPLLFSLWWFKRFKKNLGSDVQKDGSRRNRADALTSREQRQADRKQQLHPWTSLHLGHCLKVLPTLGRISQSQLILLWNTLIDTPLPSGDFHSRFYIQSNWPSWA